MSSYTQLLQKYNEAEGPEEAELKILRQTAIELLSQMATDTRRIAFRDEEMAYDLLAAYYTEKMTNSGYRLLKGEPPALAIKLANKVIGRSPGAYRVIVVWQPGYVDIYYVPAPVNNLRGEATLVLIDASEVGATRGANETDADIAA